jgi:hypothetical protein
MGLNPTMPVPCIIWILSSRVISLTTIDARSSGDKPEFTQGCDLPSDWADAIEMSEGMRSREQKRTRHNFWDGLCRGIKLTSILYKIDIVAGSASPPGKRESAFEIRRSQAHGEKLYT